MYALVDCNNFFVSCERVFRPQLEGKPVVVLSNNDGCVVSRSNESKAMGIKMGTPFFQIKTLCDSGRVIACSSNYALYGDMSSRVMTILSDSVPKIEVYSIDEAFLDLKGLDYNEILSLCRALAGKVFKCVGIPVSIGLAPTRTLAKVASHFAKKYRAYNGVCAIDNDAKRIKALSLTPIGDVWGIGRKLASKLVERGISTALDFAERPQSWVQENFNITSVRTWEELHGTACIEYEKYGRRKSICTSRSFAEMVTDEDELVAKVSDFAASCAKKLRKEGSAAYQITTFLYTNRFRDDMEQYFPSATVRVPVAASSTQEVVSEAVRALKIIYRPGYSYKKAGVIVDDLVMAGQIQSAMFDFDEKLRSRQDRLSELMDKVNSENSGLLRLATQNPGHYSDGIRCEHRSRLYTTSMDDIIQVKA